ALSEAEQQVKARDAEISALAAERTALSNETAAHEDKLKEIAGRVAGAPAQDPTSAAKRDAGATLRHVAEESLRKTLQAETDREEKGRPYRDDPLFMYLWERRYGTGTYRANNLVTYLDGLVAGLVRYRDARPNFAMLNDIPLR